MFICILFIWSMVFYYFYTSFQPHSLFYFIHRTMEPITNNGTQHQKQKTSTKIFLT